MQAQRSYKRSPYPRPAIYLLLTRTNMEATILRMPTNNRAIRGWPDENSALANSFIYVYRADCAVRVDWLGSAELCRPSERAQPGRRGPDKPAGISSAVEYARAQYCFDQPHHQLDAG